MGRYKESSDGGFLGLVLAIALGVFIGGLGAMFTWEHIQQWRLEQAARAALQEMKQSTRKLQREEQTRIASQQEADRQQREREATQTATQEAMSRERHDRDVRKQMAWQQFYQPTAACWHDSADIACANAFMAAKKRFEVQYQDPGH